MYLADKLPNQKLEKVTFSREPMGGKSHIFKGTIGWEKSHFQGNPWARKVTFSREPRSKKSHIFKAKV